MKVNGLVKEDSEGMRWQSLVKLGKLEIID